MSRSERCAATLTRKTDGSEVVKCTRASGHAEVRHAGWMLDERLLLWRDDGVDDPWSQATVRYV